MIGEVENAVFAGVSENVSITKENSGSISCPAKI